MTFAELILTYYQNIKIPKQKLPNNILWIDNIFTEEVLQTMHTFYHKYFSDNQERIMLLGINPGRFGAGVTGIPFTDPINLEEHCEIPNEFEKRHELSSKFIYDVVTAFGGPKNFFSRVYITSISPIGFIKDGKNINYYDDKALEEMLWIWMKKQIATQLKFPISNKVAFSIGAGKNLKALQKMNEEEGWFERVEALPHPRWVMQYRLKRKQDFIEEYLEKIA